MFKIILFSTLLVCTLSAPPNDDYPAAVTLTRHVPTINDNTDEKYINNQNEPQVRPTVERTYGGHVSKRDVKSNKPEPPKPEHVPAVANPPSSQSSKEHQNKPKRDLPKTQPAVLSKEEHDSSKPKIVPAPAVNIDKTKPSTHSADHHKSKRDLPPAQVLPAKSNDQSDSKKQELPTPSTGNKESDKPKRDAPKAPTPQTLPSQSHNQKDSKAQQLPALSNNKGSDKPKRDAPKTPAQTLPANSNPQNNHETSGTRLLPASTVNNDNLNKQTSNDQHKLKRDTPKVPAPQTLPTQSHDQNDSKPNKNESDKPKRDAPKVPSQSNTKKDDDDDDDVSQPRLYPATNNDNLNKQTHAEHRSKRDAPKVPSSPQTLPATSSNNNQKPEILPSSDANVPQSSSSPASQQNNHQHKRNEGSSPASQPGVKTSDKSTEENSKTSSDNVKPLKDLHNHDDDKNEQKRDIPVALAPSTSSKPETSTTTDATKDSKHEDEEHKTNDNRPITQYTKPIPVYELFKTKSDSS